MLDNLPPGAANDPSAPYNQVDIPEKEFDVTCCMTLSKTTTGFTNDYIPGASGCDYEPDGEGGYVPIPYHDDDDTSDTNWDDVFSANHKTIPELLDEFKQYLQKDLDNIDAVAEIRKHDKAFLKRKIERLIEECNNWIVDEEICVKEEDE